MGKSHQRKIDGNLTRESQFDSKLYFRYYIETARGTQVDKGQCLEFKRYKLSEAVE